MSKRMKENHEAGFTLVELLIAMVIASLVMAAVYSVYYTQQKSYIVQEEVAAMHQNLRAAMFFMEKEIRMAGCDPTGEAGAGILADSTANSIHFTEDVRGQNVGDPPDGNVRAAEEEDLEYYLNDVDGDGVKENIDEFLEKWEEKSTNFKDNPQKINNGLISNEYKKIFIEHNFVPELVNLKNKSEVGRGPQCQLGELQRSILPENGRASFAVRYVP